MEIDEEKFERLKEEVRKLYYSLGSVHCPYFGCKILFTSEGFQHLSHKGPSNKTTRTREDQYVRLKLFKLAPKLLRESRVVQDIQEKNIFLPVVHNHRKEKILKIIKYWEFWGIIDDKRIKVVVRKVGNGELHYFSVIPKLKDKNSQLLKYVEDLED